VCRFRTFRQRSLQVVDAGVFFLILSGGEIFLREDLVEIVEYARKLRFSVKLKTNAVRIRKAKAECIAALGVESVRNQRLLAPG
jgi:MoaA/NifB/PqqE/SkfB family radical SAM enzyme